MTIEDNRVYLVQELAFEGTILGEMSDRRSLIAEAHEIATGLPLLVGFIDIGEGSVRMSKTDAYAQSFGRIVFAPRAMRRFTAVHEIAHIVHQRSPYNGTPHGKEYRGVFVEMISMVYGQRYGELLRDAFLTSGLDVWYIGLPTLDDPLINIDALADATLGSRWL